MKRPSFSTHLVILWGLVATICATLAVVIWLMANSAESQQVASAKLEATTACEAVASRYSRSTLPTDSAANADLMHAILDIVLVKASGVEGGFWTAKPSPYPNGFLAYSFPTYQGSGIKRDP